MAGQVIDLIAAAQRPDGYLNTYFTFERAPERWKNLRDMHELYCAGHLIQAAIAWRRATGEARLLGVARRLADHICQTFGPRRRQGTPGHPEIEMALVELGRETGEGRYLEQAGFFLDERGRGRIGGREYHVDHRPFRQMERLAGHAVRGLYLCSGAADLYAETGEAELRQALERLWERMVQRQMYVTGGVGARHEGESFGDDYELPNERAYAETCAAIANVLWSWRMLHLDGSARYADVMELALYNGALAGISLDGLSYFYVNPLADPSTALRAGHRRQPWYDCACCPTNFVRLLAALPGLFYSVSSEPAGIWVHLYAQGQVEVPWVGGETVRIEQRTRYPWDGKVELEVQGQGRFSLFLRVPDWCGEPAGVELNDRAVDAPARAGAYLELNRDWQAGDKVRLHLPMSIQEIQPHPYLLENAGRAALRRGPLVYCLEGVDHPEADLRDIRIDPSRPVTARFHQDLLGGIAVLHLHGEVLPPGSDWQNRLYVSSETSPTPLSPIPLSLTAIPYYAWANRAPGQMQVWLRK
jgi:DUF1680 family protein